MTLNSYRKGKRAAAQDDTLKKFAEHFKICQTAEIPSKMLIKMIELDKPITLSEICYAIIRLKRGISVGFDGSSDVFIDAKDFIAPDLLKICYF